MDRLYNSKCRATLHCAAKNCPRYSEQVECSDRSVHVCSQLLTVCNDSVAAVGAPLERRVLAETVSTCVIVAPARDVVLSVDGGRHRRRRDGEKIWRRAAQRCVRLAAVEARPRPAARARWCRTLLSTDDVVAAVLRPGRQRRCSTSGTSSPRLASETNAHDSRVFSC